METADLSQHDLSGFKPERFEFAPKDATLTMRLPVPLPDASKLKVKIQGIRYTHYLRLLLDRDQVRDTSSRRERS